MQRADSTAQPATKKRGGPRAGSGPKPADGVSGTRRVQLTLDAATLATFARLGGGNVSLGAREAARLAGSLPQPPVPACQQVSTPATHPGL